MPFFDRALRDTELGSRGFDSPLAREDLAIRRRKSRCACTSFAQGAEIPWNWLKNSPPRPIPYANLAHFDSPDLVRPQSGLDKRLAQLHEDRNATLVKAGRGTDLFRSQLHEVSSISFV